MSSDSGFNSHNGYKVNLNLRNATGFLALIFVMHEFHEIMHTAVGRLICGCWGERDFNVWGLCGECSEVLSHTWIATLAGPVFTFAAIYIGYYLMSRRFDDTPKKQSLGFALIFGSVPMTRLLTVGLGGGDELMVLKDGFGGSLSDIAIWLTGFALVVLVALPPLIRAWKGLHSKKRGRIFAGFFLLPLVIDILAVLVVMNTLLQSGFLDRSGIIGSPLLVNLWTLLWVFLLVWFRKDLETLLVPVESGEAT